MLLWTFVCKFLLRGMFPWLLGIHLGNHKQPNLTSVLTEEHINGYSGYQVVSPRLEILQGLLFCFPHLIFLFSQKNWLELRAENQFWMQRNQKQMGWKETGGPLGPHLTSPPPYLRFQRRLTRWPVLWQPQLTSLSQQLASGVHCVLCCMLGNSAKAVHTCGSLTRLYSRYSHPQRDRNGTLGIRQRR